MWCNRGNYRRIPGGLQPADAETPAEAELRLSQTLHLEDVEAAEEPPVGNNSLQVDKAVGPPFQLVLHYWYHSKLWYLHLWYQCLKLGPLNRLPLVEVPWSDGADWDPALLTAEAAVLKMAGERNMLVVVVLLLRLDCWVGSHWCLQSNQLKIKSVYM